MSEGDPRGIEEIIAGHMLLPAQYAALLEPYNPSPERRLLLAILVDAIDCLFVGGRTRRRIRLQVEARNWFEDVPPRGVAFTFRTVCEYLGFDAGSFKEELLHGNANLRNAWRRLRRTVRSGMQGKVSPIPVRERGKKAHGKTYQALSR